MALTPCSSGVLSCIKDAAWEVIVKRYDGIKKAEILFIVLQMILYVTFLTIDLNEGSVTLSKWIKYSIIILCFCYALFFGKGVDKGIIFSMKLALLFTLISDLFILILDYYFVGVLTFIVAQQLYAVRISLTKVGVITEAGRMVDAGTMEETRTETEAGRVTEAGTITDTGRITETGTITETGRIIETGTITETRTITYTGRVADTGRITETGTAERKVILAKRFIIRVTFQLLITIAIVLLLMCFSVKPDPLLIASILYFISISTNVLTSFRLFAHNRYDRSVTLFTIGMGLFLLCDINVGLFNLSGFISLPGDIYHKIYSISSILMWTFYAPSQVLIALSITQKRGIYPHD